MGTDLSATGFTRRSQESDPRFPAHSSPRYTRSVTAPSGRLLSLIGEISPKKLPLTLGMSAYALNYSLSDFSEQEEKVRTVQR